MARALLTFATLLWLAAIGRDAADRWIDATQLPVTLHETSVEMRDRNGDLLRVYPVADGIWRLPVHPDQIDPQFIQMLLRYEDKRFATHHGVDPIALTRAALQALVNGHTVSGGSTLTMQVARLLEDGSTGKWSGKLRQMRVALALERRLTKPEILRLYLTHAPYGGNLEGVRAATLAWFGKEPTRLTPSEAALLVALPQSPETRRPDRHPDTARAARDRVLVRMAAQDVLKGEAMRVALTVKTPRTMRPFPRLAPHLTDATRQTVPHLPRHDLTLEATLQASMETLIATAARTAGDRTSAAVIIADHHTGEILASVGSPAYSDADNRQGFVDMTRAIRSPGSTLKPLVYALAFDQGLAHPETLIHDGPVLFGRYSPRNFDGQFRGDVRVREALQLSLNIPVVKLTDDLGPARVMAAMGRAGVDAKLPGGKPGLAIALGGVGVSLHDLVQLYAGLAQGGQGPALHSSGSKQASKRIVSDVAAWHIGDILRGLAPPTGAPARAVAYKTGTSYGHRDAWAIGWDGRHVIGVWMGRADGTPVPGAFGGDLAAPILFDAFGLLKSAFDPLPPPPPHTLITAAADLPQPLQRHRPRGGTAQTENAPQVTFPPDGARLAATGSALVIKLRGGQAPFTVLANGAPVATNLHSREIDIPTPGAGFSTLVIVDRAGQSDRVTVHLND
ncbi:penicillin-binding protein 1C [Falsiphaeobacter marinintestinus]|uniref:penicillin-binding protein 1C n=1 Tax=Falsiphaeobacter marinintestinus TaxID=1492905 RepID=UPI0011B6A696|nr:penicillin-binding protein 1C [Phaeobacter marinintestinus]